MPIDCGNTVANPARATPCNASFHQLYGFMPNRSTGFDTSIIKEIFSSSVSSCNSNSALCSEGKEESRKSGRAQPKKAKPNNKIPYLIKLLISSFP